MEMTVSGLIKSIVHSMYVMKSNVNSIIYIRVLNFPQAMCKSKKCRTDQRFSRNLLF